MEIIDQETRERYELITRTLVCPQCGQDVEKTTLGVLAKRIQDSLDEGEDPDSVAYVCSHPDCRYAIAIGEKSEVAA